MPKDNRGTEKETTKVDKIVGSTNLLKGEREVTTRIKEKYILPHNKVKIIE